MKTRLFTILVAMVLGLTTTAFAQDFNTGSNMMNSGSSLSSNVYGVGATSVDDPMASSTTTNASPNRGRTLAGVGEGGEERSEQSPIGAPYIMLLFAAGAAGVVAMRRRRTIER